MKRMCTVLLVMLLLCGCGKSPDAMDRAVSFRSSLLNGKECTFLAEITADYFRELYTFRLQCSCDGSGNVTFRVISPESISGITGIMSAESGKLTFDDHALLFSMMAEGRVSPVSGPWVMMQALRSGYIKGCGQEKDGFVVSIDDSYNQDALQVIIRTDDAFTPKSAEIYYRESRILTIIVEDFSIL